MVRKVLFFLLLPLMTWAQVQIGNDIVGLVDRELNGYSVDISSYGNVIAVGSPKNPSNGFDSGYVRVYEFIEGDWVQIGQDIIGLAAGDWSGFNVKLSTFGNIVAIGSPYSDINGSETGNVRVFEYKNGQWIQRGNTIEGRYLFEQTGFSISISLDGNTIAVGAPYKDWNNDYLNPAGTARVFQYSQNTDTWVQIGQDIDGQGWKYFSGAAVELSGDGKILAIGTILEGFGGAVRVYENISGSWIQRGSTLHAIGNADRFGRSLSLSVDGSVLAIGGYLNSSTALKAGHVRVFEYLSNDWQQVGSDIFGTVMLENLGFAISLSDDGKTLAVGGFYASALNLQDGVFRVYENRSGVWTKLFPDIIGRSTKEYLGFSVALSANGTRAVVSAPQLEPEDHRIFSSGFVRIYDWSKASNESFNSKIDFKIYPNPATDILNIDLNEDLNLEQITIFNNLGQKIITTKQVTINVENLATGLYFIEVMTNQGKATKKVLIK